MHPTPGRRSTARTAGLRWALVTVILVIAALVFAACTAPTSTPAATTEATEAAEATVEATTEATAETTEEATEESAATEEATTEATAEPTADATADATAEATQEGVASSDIAALGDPARGGYIFAMTTGCGCHFNRDLQAPAGGNTMEGPFGVIHVPNITSDPETGLGNWTDEAIVNAIRRGVKPDGTRLHPMMPYMDWSVMSDQDAYDLVAALRTLPPVVNEVPPSELSGELPPFDPPAPPATAPTAGVERGAYLVALARCNMCHTPRTESGAPDTTRLLAGATMRDEIAPNLTPDESAGLGGIPDDDIVHFLMTGEYDDGSTVEGPMEDVIHNGTSKLTEEDVRAIVAYLRSIPPVAEQPQ